MIATVRPALIVSIHSFTPQLETRPDEARPWQAGVLYNTDDRAARVAIPMLQAQGWMVGDNQPYSGRVLNYTMNRHAEANGIAYLGLEIRQDGIASPAGVDNWADHLAPVISAVRDVFA
jgi:predicted N-formylglutamate amidohydrolase